MALKQQIQTDLKEALKRKEVFLCGVLRFLNAAIKNRQLEKRAKLSKSQPIEKLEELSQLTDDEVIEVISSEIKKRRESISQFEKGGRSDLVEQEKKELEILMDYMPKQMTEEEIRSLVKETVKKLELKSPKDTGKVMAALMPQVKGRAEGGLVNKIVQDEFRGS